MKCVISIPNVSGQLENGKKANIFIQRHRIKYIYFSPKGTFFMLDGEPFKTNIYKLRYVNID